MSLFSKIRGTIENLFSIGLGGPQIKNNAGKIEARDNVDAAFTNVRGADPVIADDLATKRYVDTQEASSTGAERAIRFAIGTAASQSSGSNIPANAVVLDARLEITTPYSNGSSIQLGQTGTPALLQGSSDNLPTSAGTYEVEQDSAWGASALPVLVTVGGAPSAGAGVVVVTYSNPNT